jgi:parallel beta-helix repeat protein
MKRAGSAIAALVICVLLSAAAPAAQAQPVSCGQVITADTTLEADLTCWNETALFIGAPGITLDLGGHTVSGQATIHNEGHDDVTIQNGRLVDDGSEGMVLTGVTGNVVRNLSASGLLGGITLVDSDENRVVNNRVAGVFLSLTGGSDRNVVARNVATGYESGIGIFDSSGNRVRNNISWTDEDAPFALIRAHRNVVRDNTLVSGFSYSEALVPVIGGNGNRIIGNHIVSSGVRRGSGITLEGSNRTLIEANQIEGTPLGVHIRSGLANELRSNVAVGTPPDVDFPGSRDGFLVGPAARRTLVSDNSASDFANNGFSLYGAETQAGGNSATDNGAWGIDALSSVIDLGGNSASGNGASAQCRNITCG